jgi:hypothetical protein
VEKVAFTPIEGGIMKKWGLLVVAALAAFTLMTPAAALAGTPILADGFPDPGVQAVWQITSGQGLAQSFTAIDGTLHSADLVLGGGNLGGTFQAQLYAVTGTYGTNSKPTGLPLATSAPVSGSSVGGSKHTVTFLFDDSVTLTAGTHYAIVLMFPSGGSYLNWYQAAGASHPGNDAVWTSSRGWYLTPGNDLLFDIYETPPDPVPASSWWSIGLIGVAGLALAIKGQAVIFS